MKCRKITESKNSKVTKTKNGRIMFLSKCEVRNHKKKLNLLKKKKSSGALSSLGIKRPLSKNQLVGPLLV